MPKSSVEFTALKVAWPPTARTTSGPATAIGACPVVTLRRIETTVMWPARSTAVTWTSYWTSYWPVAVTFQKAAWAPEPWKARTDGGLTSGPESRAVISASPVSSEALNVALIAVAASVTTEAAPRPVTVGQTVSTTEGTEAKKRLRSEARLQI